MIEARGPTGVDFDRIPRFKPVVDRLTVDDLGRLWVRRTNGASEIEFDIFDATGAPLARAVWGRYRTSIWRPFVVRGDHVYAVVLGADDVEHVVRLSIAR